MDIKYLSERVSYSKPGDKFLVVISGRISKFQLNLLGVWLLGWTFCGVAVFTQLFEDFSREVKLALFIYMVFWMYFEYKIVYAFIWRKWGAELIRVDGDSLKIKKDIKGYGKVRSFLMDNIKNISLVDNPGTFASTINNSFWSTTGEKICFDYLNKTHYFGIQLNEEEARKLVSKLKSEIRRMA